MLNTNSNYTTVNNRNTYNLIISQNHTQTQAVNEINVTQQLNNMDTNLPPSCIVIGCKNAHPNTNIRYYQVPFIDNSNPANSLARQWYINTLREDLLDSLSPIRPAFTPSLIPLPHYVCIEHFDEESFIIGNNPTEGGGQQVVMILKEDAVPSLFEIEVFQKMIAHQEKFAMNQQQKQQQIVQYQQQQQQPVQQFQPRPMNVLPVLNSQPSTSNTPSTSLLSNLIFNENQSAGQNSGAQQSNNKIKTILSPTVNKRARMDPDFRAALIQRVPKAVKRTSVISVPQPQQEQPVQPRMAKAVKHTMPRSLLQPHTIINPPVNTNSRVNSATSNNTNKLQKAVKHTSNLLSNNYLKEILPPPIMQSTKRPLQTSAPVNKAIKHTGGGTNAYYQSNKLINPTSTTPIPVLSSQIQPDTNKNPINNALSSNKITITTTYVYKRVQIQPEIDLDLECEEEEFIFVKAPKPPPKSVQSKCEQTDDFDNEKKNSETENKVKTEQKSDTKLPLTSLNNKRAPLKTESKKAASPVKQPGSKVAILSVSNSDAESTQLINNYQNILSRYYSRKKGAMSAALESSSSSKTKAALLPPDLRTGNYPAKCNVCDIVLENNIEMTSHICSHLESGGGDTYISPFDAVTTTCAVCEVTFTQPFDLIKHLDLKHMKQLGEYKCRICEEQHSKFSDLIRHLNKTHSHEEMPYRCDACGFRTSFYADAIYHIKKEHVNTLRHFCPYCLKSFVLPYNEKLGHVQCNIFYSHLITHFNKHENNHLMPSKCKHCTKCILHVRFMKEHLMYDHNCNFTPTNEDTLNPSKKQPSSSLTNKNLNEYEQNKPKLKQGLTKQLKTNISSNSSTCSTSSNRRRKRQHASIDFKNDEDSDLDEDSKEIESDQSEIDDDFTDLDSRDEKDDVYDFNKYDSKIKNIKKEHRLSDQGKLEDKYKRGQLRAGPASTQKIKPKIESSTDEVPQVPSRNKAVKRTSGDRRSYMMQSARRVGRTGSRSMSVDNTDGSPGSSSRSSSAPNQAVSVTLVGNVKFTCNRNQFKCVECDETDIRSHYRTEYTCHQCHYNTNCSKSFEYHLHGHLAKKRIALWNKVLKDTVEVYRCPCGFVISSARDNNFNANTGNKVATHLLNCEYRYCYFSTIDSNNQESENDYKYDAVLDNPNLIIIDN